MSAEQNRARVAAHRASLRAQGLRPIQIWIPDTRTPEFQDLASRESCLSAAQAEDSEVTDWIERNGILDDDDAPR